MRLALLVLASSVLAAPYDTGLEPFEERLRHAPWEDRLRVVRTLADKGEAGRDLLKLAARDPDWQVRAAAAEALGRFKAGGLDELSRLAGADPCRLVRLAAAHQLGRLGRPAPGAGEGDASQCVSAYLPGEEAVKARAVKAKDSTRPDAAGCSYLRFQRLGKGMCPQGMTVHGIGRPPESPNLLKVRGEGAGVALCCPAGGEEAPQPVEVECRIIPEDCPPPWAQMDAPADPITGKEGRYRRDERHAQGDLNWVQCCRPVPIEGGEEELADAEAAPAPRPRPRRAPAPPPAEAPASPPAEEAEPEPEEPPVRTAGPSPEALIARRALGRLAPPPETLPPPKGPPPKEEIPVTADADLAEAGRKDDVPGLDGRDPLGDPEDLPAPVGAPVRNDTEVAADAATVEVSRGRPDAGREARRRLGRADGALAAPAGPAGRQESQVTAAADLQGDAGLKRLPDDPLPALLERLTAPEAAVRARAAQMLGARGAAARAAAKALLKALKDPSPRVRADAALALGSVTAGSDEGVPALKKLLKDPHPDVRYSAAAALGRVGTPAAGRAFSGYLKGETRRAGGGTH